jgi:hypothetical protein
MGQQHQAPRPEQGRPCLPELATEETFAPGNCAVRVELGLPVIIQLVSETASTCALKTTRAQV